MKTGNPVNAIIVRSLSLITFAIASAGSIASDDPLRIGLILSLSGSLAAAGIAQRHGAELAITTFPASLGRARFEVEIVDDECKAESAGTVARRLVEVKKVQILVGGTCFQSAAAVAAVSQSLKVPYVSTSPSVNDQPVSSPPYAFFLGGPKLKASQFAETLSRQSKVPIRAGRDCFATFLANPSEMSASSADVGRPYAELCPFIRVDQHSWIKFARQYEKQYGGSPDAAAAVGYVAMQISIQALVAAKGDSQKSLDKLREGKFDTLLGVINPIDSNPLDAVLVAIYSPLLQQDARVALIAATKKKTCDNCTKMHECPQGTSQEILVATKSDCCKKTNECPQGSLLLFR